MTFLRTLLPLLFLSIAVALPDATSAGYYLDNTHNLVKVPIIDLPIALQNKSVIGVASFYNRLNETGWTFLQVTINSDYSDYQQMYAAGFLEGYATYDLIWDAWNNFNDFTLNNESFISSGAQAFVRNQTDWILSAGKENSEDPFWSLVNASFGQQQGMYDGYVRRIIEANRSDMNLTFDQFYYLTNMGDLEDIIPAYSNSSRTKTQMECSTFFKLTSNDLIASHATFNNYALMLRVFKSFHIPLKNSLVKAKKMMFSSRPGDLESKDDFYMMDTDLIVVETSLNNYNVSNYDEFHYSSLPAWLRNLVANRVASSGKEWADVFFTNRSGTHNNQWLVLDYTKYDLYKNNLSAAEGIMWMVEEYFALESALDVTQELLVKQGYVAGYNVPYNQSIYDISGYSTNYNYTYTNDPRAVLFREYGPAAKDFNSVKHLMRYDNVSDTGDICKAIAPRCDLLQINASDFGAIDAKVTNRQFTKEMVASIISGPTTEDNLPAFNWDNWPNAPKRGMPTVFDFDWLLYQADVGPLNFNIDTDIISI